MARVLSTLWAVVLLAAVCVEAQPPAASTPPPTGAGLIVGQVVDGRSSRGVASAIVTLAGPLTRRVMATTDGRFVFRDLPAGTYTLTASKHGYLDGSFGARRPGGGAASVVLADGERQGGLTVSLWRHGSLAGTIVDEAGEALIGITVTATRRTVAGRRRLVPGGSGVTDDRGVYRISKLIPGDYIVTTGSSQVFVPASIVQQYQDNAGAPDALRTAGMQAVMQLGATTLLGGTPNTRRIGDYVQTLNPDAPTPPHADGPRVFAYPTVFFQGATAVGSATAVTVGSGEERPGVDFQLRPVPTARVSGVVAGSAGPAANIPVRLTPVGLEDLGRSADAAGTVTDGSGGFTFPGVPAGDYMLRIVQTPRPTAPTGTPTTIQMGTGVVISSMTAAAEPPPIPADPTFWATVPLAVSDSDVTGVAVTLRTGVRITGRVEFEGTAEKPARDQLTRMPVLIEPAEGQMDRLSTPPGRIDARGQFTTYGVPAGKYFIRVAGAPPGWTFKGSMLGDRDVSDLPLELDTNDVADVVITFTDRPASLAGTVQLTERARKVGASVVVFPADSKSWIETGSNPRRMRRIGTTAAGTYQVGGLPPGEYYVAAIPDDFDGDWQDPKFLETLSQGATHVQLSDGDKTTRDLRVQEVR